MSSAAALLKLADALALASEAVRELAGEERRPQAPAVTPPPKTVRRCRTVVPLVPEGTTDTDVAAATAAARRQGIQLVKG